MFVGCLAMLIIFMRLFQETPTGKVLHHYLVEVPLEKMDKIDAGHLIFLMIGLLLIPSFAAVFSADIAIVMAWDFALYYEALIATWTIASVTKLKLMGTKLRIVSSISPVGFQSLACNQCAQRGLRSDRNPNPPMIMTIMGDMLLPLD